MFCGNDSVLLVASIYYQILTATHLPTSVVNKHLTLKAK